MVASVSARRPLQRFGFGRGAMVVQVAAPLAGRDLLQPGDGGERHLRAQRLHLHGVGGDGEIESLRIERVIGLEARFVVFAAPHERGRKAGVSVSQNDMRLLESHGGRIGNAERGVVEGEGALQASLPRVDDGAIHGSGKLQLGRELRAHVARQFQDGRHGKAIPVEADGPVRLREIIGGAEMDGQRQCRIAGGSGMQFQLLADQVEAAADLLPPALAVAGHHVPTVHIADIEAAGDPHVVERPGQVKART